MDRRVTDREVYPAVWITLGTLLVLFLAWKFLLGEPRVSQCWIHEHWGLYCPGCGGTRALIALMRGRVLKACHYHPAVPVTAILAAVYLTSQTLWRLQGRRGWVLRYDHRWPGMLIGLLVGNCVLRNLLLLVYGIEI